MEYRYLPLLLSLSIAFTVLLADTQNAWPQSGNNDQEAETIDYSQLKTRRTPVLGNKVYEALARSQELVETEKNFTEARKILTKLLASVDRGRLKLNKYELANVWNTVGFLDYSQERYRGAVRSYRKVIANPADIPLPLLSSTLYTLSQLSFVLENYSAAIRYLRQWFQVSENPGPDSYFLLAQAYYLNDNPRQSLSNALRGKRRAAERGTAMRENWWQLLRVLYYEKKSYGKVIEVLHELVRGWPKKSYWLQLSGMHGHLEQELDQLTALKLLDVQDLLNREKEVTGLASLLLSQDLPYYAAVAIETGIKNGLVEETEKNLELLGSAWQQAREFERALPVLEKAAKLSEKGEIYSRLSAVYMDLYRFADAARAAENGLKKGKLKRADTVQIIRGMSLYNIKEYALAKKAFSEAGKDERSSKLAMQWHDYINRQVEREKLLREDISDEDFLRLIDKGS